VGLAVVRAVPDCPSGKSEVCSDAAIIARRPWRGAIRGWRKGGSAEPELCIFGFGLFAGFAIPGKFARPPVATVFRTIGSVYVAVDARWFHIALLMKHEEE
jgi:hypothetical protein